MNYPKSPSTLYENNEIIAHQVDNYVAVLGGLMWKTYAEGASPCPLHDSNEHDIGQMSAQYNEWVKAVISDCRRVMV